MNWIKTAVDACKKNNIAYPVCKKDIVGQSVKRKGKNTGCIQMEEGFLLVIRYDKLFLLPHVYGVAVEHGGIMLYKVVTFKEVYPDDEDQLNAKYCQHYVFYILERY